MKMNIHYTNTTPTEWIENTLVEGFNEVSERLGGVLFENVRVLFEVVNSKVKAGRDLYRCKVFGYSPQMGRFEIQKTASEPSELLQMVIDTTRKMLGKRKFALHQYRRLYAMY